MNRTVKDATVKVFHSETLASLSAHVLAFVTAYNFAKHLKALRWRTPFQAICDAWTRDPAPFKINPHHLIPGPYSLGLFEGVMDHERRQLQLAQSDFASKARLEQAKADRDRTDAAVRARTRRSPPRAPTSPCWRPSRPRRRASRPNSRPRSTRPSATS